MDDSGDRELPCPTCGEETTHGEPCDLCRQEDEAMKMAMDAAKAGEDAKKLAAATAAKYPAIKPFDGMGEGM